MALSDLLFGRGPSKSLAEILSSTFLEEDYFWLASGLKPNTVVLDIGAYVGDTAIYFAMQDNVSEVRAYEPYPAVFETLRQNVEKSRRKAKIKLFNNAIGKPGSDYAITLSESAYAADEALVQGKGRQVRVIGMDKALGDIQGNSVAVKINVDGGEFFVIDEKLDLGKVYKMQICVYPKFGNASVLEDLLKNKGFKTSKEPKHLPDQAWLYAWR
ncbi:MAG: FkbM family methyltransferase [Candidatus Micrarchaeia archaeon]